jgi:hypothetical protein
MRISFDIESNGRCLTPCPYGEKKHGVCVDSPSRIMVHSLSCTECKYHKGGGGDGSSIECDHPTIKGETL